MKILYVWDADYPWDVRTEKICLALTAQGHEVIIAARNLAGSPRHARLPEGRVERLPELPAFVRRTLTFPVFFNPLWIYHLRWLIEVNDVELVIVRDIPLAPTALMTAGRGIPVVLDMAENYPAMIADIWRDRRTGLFDFLVRNPRIVAAVEKLVVHRVDHTITVVEESRDRLVSMGVPEARVSVVSNTPSVRRITARLPSKVGGPLRIVYLGLMERHRGIGDLIDAAGFLDSAGIPFAMDLIGDGRDLATFQEQAGRRALTGGAVTFHGRVPYEDALRIVEQADVGVVPHHATEAWSTTIPNKLFDYMAAGLAVVSSDARPAARVVNATGAGRVFRSGDAHELALQLESFQDAAYLEQCRAAGQGAIRHAYNWESDVARLTKIVQRARPRLRHTAAVPSSPRDT